MTKKNNNTFFSWYEWFLLICIVALNVIVALINNEFKIMPITAAISGVLCVVLAAKKNILNYLFGLIQVSIYAYLCWIEKYWGDAALNALYYVPMQFIGFFIWKKHLQDGSNSEVKAYRLSGKNRLLVFIASLVAVLISAQILIYIKDTAPYLDSITTVLSVIAMALMVGAYSEQWYLWIIINAATIVKWLLSYLDGAPSSLVVCTMWFVFLLNSVYGLIRWSQHSSTNYT